MLPNIPDGPLAVPSFDGNDITGFRVWKLGGDKDVSIHLQAVTTWAAWPAGRAMSGCPEYGGGVHACRTLEYLCTHIQGYTNGRHINVLGEVALTGRVYVYEEGYKAEFGYPTVLYIDTNEANPGRASREIILELCRVYGCEFREIFLPQYGVIEPEILDAEHTCGRKQYEHVRSIRALRKTATTCDKCQNDLEHRIVWLTKSRIDRQARVPKMLAYMAAREQAIPGRNWSEFCVTETKMLLDAGIAPDIARKTVIDKIVELRTNNPNDPCRNWVKVRSNLAVSYDMAIRAHEARMTEQAD